MVPDFAIACRAYLDHFATCEADPAAAVAHDQYIAELLEQSVRKEAFGTSQQKPLRRFVENLVLGDARKRGETHQWMYDRFSLQAKLLAAGYSEVHIQDYDTSLIPGWSAYGLDVDEQGEQGRQYKPGSLYVEAVK